MTPDVSLPAFMFTSIHMGPYTDFLVFTVGTNKHGLPFSMTPMKTKVQLYYHSPWENKGFIMLTYRAMGEGCL